MCGICGMALPEQLNRRADRSLLLRMRDTLVHRGPDDAGIYLAGGIGLAHRRLSIVDVLGGHQPMTSEDGTLQIVFNGEIYNHPQLRPQLEALGHRYQNHSDTETILHLYEEHGTQAVRLLSGMFAFALWDEGRGRLLLARDRMGIKPLYYVHRADGSLYFASEIKALLAAGAVRPELNYQALPDYLASHAPSGEETLFRGVRRLLPGHLLIWQRGQLQMEQYWDADFTASADARGQSDADHISEWGRLFEAAVRSHLMSDVPLGVFLSGGIDSSAIAAVMSRMVSGPIRTFSVAFAEREANELEYARLVARTFRTEHHEVIVSPQEYFRALPDLIWHEDEPLAHFASVPLFYVSRLAARHVKVVLTGEGSDELLAGYYKYRRTLLNLSVGRVYQRWVPSALRRLVQTGGRQVLPESYGHKLARTFIERHADTESLYFDNFAVFSRAMQQQMLTPATLALTGQPDPSARGRQLLSQAQAGTLLNQLLYVDQKIYLHELLMKQDQMSMAASIESRVPFLDAALVDFTNRLPERLKLYGWTTKYILRRAMQGVLPEAILKRPKMGFPVPVGRWFRGEFRPLVEDCLLSERALGRGLFNREFLERLLAEHISGTRDHAQRLWALVNLELWLRRFMDEEISPGLKAENEVGSLVG
ncbi:MAG: asparagine synthase (glutamine-hydrolyzing) [Blastocatellia bacterium]